MNEQKEPGMSMNEALDIIIARLAEERRAAWIAEDTVKDGEPSKICTKCGKEKPLRSFHMRRASRDGKTARCRMCNREDYRQRYHSDETFRRERTDYTSKMHLKRQHPQIYARWVAVAQSVNRKAVSNGNGPIYVGRGQIKHDVATAVA